MRNICRSTAVRGALVLTAVLVVNPVLAQDKTEALISQGFELIENQRFAPAIKKLEKALKSNPESFDAHYGITVACNNLGELDKAVAHAQRATELATSAAQRIHAYNQLGVASFNHLRSEIRKEIASHGPRRGGSTENALSKRDWSIAEGAFRRVLELDPKLFPIARLSLAQVLGHQRRFDQALAELATWERKNKKRPKEKEKKAIANLRCQARISQQNPQRQLFEISSEHTEIIPPKKLSAPAPKYTEIALKERTEGLVALEAVIDRNGDIACAQVVTGLPHGLSGSAEQAVSGWKFDPARRNGAPVAVIYYLTVTFRLAKIRKLEDLVTDN